MNARIFTVLAIPLLACSSDPSSDSAGSGGGDGGVSSGNSSDESTCVSEINRYRAMNGKAPYARWNAEEACADSQAQSDSSSGKAHGAFTKCHEFGQNECPGWPGPQSTMIKDCLKAMWAEGPGGGHHDIMNSDDYTMVACGFYTTASGEIWSVQDFK